MKITKKHTFLISILLLAVPVGAIVIQETCDYKALGWCWRHWSLLGRIGGVFFWPSIFVFILTILVAPLPPNVFERWKNFAVWSTPTIIVLSYLLIASDDAHTAGLFTYSFTPIYLGIIYGAFVITSLVIIIKSWIRARRERS